MPRPLIIGISGHDGTGKSTLAKNLKAIIEAEGYDVAIAPWAYGVKSDLAKLGIPAFRKPTPTWVRQLLRFYGTNLMRNLFGGPDYWVKRNAKRIQKEYRYFDVVLIDDTRFPNEAHWIMEQGGYTIPLYREATEPDAFQNHPEIVRRVWEVRRLCDFHLEDLEDYPTPVSLAKKIAANIITFKKTGMKAPGSVYLQEKKSV